MASAISTLLAGEELQGDDKYWGTVAGMNGFIYGIPFYARRVVKFNTLDKSITHIGPDFDTNEWYFKWSKGAMTGSGIIYCAPYDSELGILKIDTNTDTVTALNANLLPERGQAEDGMWVSCAAALDGCIYFMPHGARYIMKLDPDNNDAVSYIEYDLVNKSYVGTVVGIDGCVYGIPSPDCHHILKHDPVNGVTSFVGEEVDKIFKCTGDGALGRDGYIYAADNDGLVLKIDTTNNSHSIVGTRLDISYQNTWWCDAILGIDGCMYWPPLDSDIILKYDPYIDQTSYMMQLEDNYGDETSQWFGGSLAPDGVIYCMPNCAEGILSIDPWKQYKSTLQKNMERSPEKLGCIFLPSDDSPNDTNFYRALTKFGHQKVFEVLEDCMPPADQVCTISNLYPFMLAASYGTRIVIYQ